MPMVLVGLTIPLFTSANVTLPLPLKTSPDCTVNGKVALSALWLAASTPASYTYCVAATPLAPVCVTT